MSSGVVGIALIVAIGALMTHSVGWTAAEMSVLEGFSRIHTGLLDAVSLGIDFLFSPRIAAVLLAGVAVLILLFTRRWRAAVEFVVLVAGSWLGTEVIKYIVQRPRPDSSLLAHPLISVDGDRAAGSWLLYHMFTEATHIGTHAWVQGIYQCEYRKAGGRWKISDLKWKQRLGPRSVKLMEKYGVIDE